MKKFLILLISAIAFTQITLAQSVYKREVLSNDNVIVSTGQIVDMNDKAVPQGEEYIPVTKLKGKDFIEKACQKFKAMGVKGWIRIGFNSDLKGNIVTMDIIYPKALQMKDKDVSEILDVAKKHCRLDFKIEGVYKYVTYVSCSYDINLSE